KIVKGVLQLTIKQVASIDYVAENKGEHDKTLVVEHPRRAGWTLTQPAKADETTDALYRFKGHVAAGKGTKLTVREEIVQGSEVAILSADVTQVLFYARAEPIPPAVRDALVKAGRMRGALADTQRQIDERNKK